VTARQQLVVAASEDTSCGCKGPPHRNARAGPCAWAANLSPNLRTDSCAVAEAGLIARSWLAGTDGRLENQVVSGARSTPYLLPINYGRGGRSRSVPDRGPLTWTSTPQAGRIPACAADPPLLGATPRSGSNRNWLGVPARNTNSQLPGAEQLRGIEDKVGSDT
jgi:hypothetical protein